VSDLRSNAAGAVSGFSGSGINLLSDLGIETNGQTNTLSVSDTSTLDSALQNNLQAVEQFFTSTNGWGAQMNTYLNGVVGTNGTVPNHQTDLTAQSTAITTQISNLEAKITSDSAQWTSEFEAMEQAESQTNQELTYLSEQISNGSL
jgi:flagellar hook-associated protein 2